MLDSVLYVEDVEDLTKLPINQILLEDCIKGMAKLPANKIDLIATDPPFAINFKAKKANYNRTPKLVMNGYKDLDVEDYDYFTFRWIEECKRVLKPNGTMYIISGYNHLAQIRNAIEGLDLHLQNEIIWKYQFGVVTSRKFVTSHYNISFVSKKKTGYKFYKNCRFRDSDRKLGGGSSRYTDMEDVWIIPREYWTGQKKTPTKLPIALCEKMIAYSTKKNDIVLDPFVGSGQMALAAKQMGRRYLGYEIVKNYCNFARKRLHYHQK